MSGPQASAKLRMAHFTLLTGLAVLALASPAMGQVFAAPNTCTVPGSAPDLLPRDRESRNDLLRTTAFDATVYGLSAYLQYEQLYRQVADKASSNWTGFFRFSHERDLAGPDYATFKVPNSDTLYSTAWLDLRSGPVEIEIPPTHLRYFTLNVFDIFGNPDNLSNRTIGFRGGRFLVVPPGWSGSAPPGVKVWPAGSAQLWVLMRAFAQSARDVEVARTFQDQVRIIPPADAPAADPAMPKPEAGAAGFLRSLDYILRANGCRPGEEALVSRFRPLGVLAARSFALSQIDPADLPAIELGYRAALDAITRSKSQLGVPTSTGWVKVDKGNYGFNYLRRSVTNAAGLGANVREENASYTAFVDGSGKTLDGAKTRYRLHLPSPPPVDAFWSVTLYDAKTFALYPNSLKRYLVSDRTSGLKVGKDGSIDILVQNAPRRDANWLPAPKGPFFIVLRAYSPRPPMLAGEWQPPAVEAIEP